MEYFEGNIEKNTSKNPLVKYAMNKFYKDLDNLMEQLQVKSILDAGCGEGFVINHIKQNNRHVNIEGIDLLPEALEKAVELNHGIKISQGDIYQLNFQSDTFDLVLVNEVLEHLDNPELAIEEVKRISNNYLIFSVPNEPIWRIANISRGRYLKHFGNTPGHIQNWSKKEFLKLIEGHFEILKIQTPVLLWTMVLCKKN